MTNGTNVFHTREDFLSNNGNKIQLSRLLSKELQKEGHAVISCDVDADIQIVNAALDIFCDNNLATVLAEDTVILFLLVYFWSSEKGDVYLRTEAKKYQPLKLVNFRSVVASLSSNVVNNILFIHAWRGYDTTFSTYGHLKTALFKIGGKRSLCSNEDLFRF